MNSFKEIGGYFGLETLKRNNIIDNNIALNSARNCLRYVIKAFNITEVYLPYYTCPVVWESVKKENCKINYYHIDKNFMPKDDFPENAFILYTNYFGICSDNVKKLSGQYKNLIIDNAQAFYMPKYGVASFNSIRKFFGVPDGAILYTGKKLDKTFNTDVSYLRCSHLLKRHDISASFGYSDFKKNDDSLINEPIKKISNLTKAIFESIDIENAKTKRIENFNCLHKNLKAINELDIFLNQDDVPMVYPLLIKNENLRNELIKNKIYVATYWDKLPEDYPESYFQKHLIPLPIDQRYNKDDMREILEVINV